MVGVFLLAVVGFVKLIVMFCCFCLFRLFDVCFGDLRCALVVCPVCYFCLLC